MPPKPPNFLKQYTIKKVSKKHYANGAATTEMKYYRVDKQPISLEDVRKITLHYSNQVKNAGGKIAVRGLAIDGYRTLKDENNEMLTESEYDEYYVNKVIVTQKYKSFHQLQFYVTM